MADVLEPADFSAAGSFVAPLHRESIVLEDGPGFDSEGDTPIRQAISGNT